MVCCQGYNFPYTELDNSGVPLLSVCFQCQPRRITFEAAGGLAVWLDLYQATSCIWSVWPS